MPPTNSNILNNRRINAVMAGLMDVRELPGRLVWCGRIPDVPALDGEIMARYTGHVQIADLIADDAAAATYQTGSFVLESTSVPNLKAGVNMGQAMLNHLYALQNQATRDPLGIFSNWEGRTLDNLRLGVMQRKEALHISMLCDGLTYDRLGLKISAGWGMPSDLKPTVNVPWAANPSTATPVADLLALKLVASSKYGVTFDRVSMTTTDFQAMIATTEFQNKAKLYLPAGLTFANLSLDKLDDMQALAGRVLGMTIELNDSRYWSQAPDGTTASYPFHPAGKVILTSTAFDGDANTWDFANGIVTESIVAGIVSMAYGDLGGEQYGPVAYATPTNVNLNPPGVTYWGVARGFPRKHLLQSSAVLTIV